VGLFGTGGLEAQKLMMGAEEGALGAGFVAGQDGEGVGRAGVAEKDAGEAVGGGKSLVFVVDVFGVIDQAEVEGAGFQTAEAAKAPGGHDDLLDEEGFDGADGLVLLFEGQLDCVELVRVFDGDDGVLGGEAVFEGVEADGGLACGGLGAGGFEGIGAVGVDLLLGSHGWRSLGNVAPRAGAFDGRTWIAGGGVRKRGSC
jgi:hypothetical protein